MAAFLYKSWLVSRHLSPFRWRTMNVEADDFCVQFALLLFTFSLFSVRASVSVSQTFFPRESALSNFLDLQRNSLSNKQIFVCVSYLRRFRFFRIFLQRTSLIAHLTEFHFDCRLNGIVEIPFNSTTSQIIIYFYCSSVSRPLLIFAHQNVSISKRRKLVDEK